MKYTPLLFAAAIATALPSFSYAEPQLKAAAIAAPDRYGAEAARQVLKEGGNAVDAAVATAFALAVTYPEAGNIGGGGFMTLYIKGKPYFLDYRERAPGRAGRDMYLDGAGNPVERLSTNGPLAVATPGTVMGLWEAHKRFGRLPWAVDMAPAIRLARQGFVVHPQQLPENESPPPRGATNFYDYLGGMRAGEVFRQPELADTLGRIAKGGASEFYHGKTARLLIAEMNRGPRKGLVTLDDLARYRAKWREPLISEWRGMIVITAPPPSSGGVALLQMLTMKADAASLFAGASLNSPKYIHLTAEIEKRVFADRAAYLGDPDFIKVPVSQLLAPGYLAKRASEINPAAPSATASVTAGLEKPQTTHFSIVDRDGNAVSNSYTLNGDFGSAVFVKGAGFLLNNEMDDFSVKPGAPNMYGAVGGEANAIAPYKTPLSSMTPTILTRNGKVVMVIGTPGGTRIFTSVYQVLVSVYDYGLSLKEAQASARYHHQLLPSQTIFTEPQTPPPAETKAALEALGYKLENQGWSGDIEAIRIDKGEPDPEPDPRDRGVGLVVR
jgi:gamma-glutamyltranspeptidase / glutathione hydrolase